MENTYITYKLFLCDPYKNTDCRKSGCSVLGLGDCSYTSHKRFAKKDINGNPIECTDPKFIALCRDSVILERD